MRKRALLALGCALWSGGVPGHFGLRHKKNADDARQFLRQIPNTDEDRAGPEPPDFRPASRRCRSGPRHGPQEVDRPATRSRPDSRKPRSGGEAEDARHPHDVRRADGAQLSDAADRETDGGGADAVSRRSGPAHDDREAGGQGRAQAGPGRPGRTRTHPRRSRSPISCRGTRSGPSARAPREQRLAAFQALIEGQAG